MLGKQVPRRIERHKVQCCEQRPICLPLSGRFFQVALQRLRRLEGNGSNNCTGNYSIKRPIHSPLAFFLLCLFPLCSMQAAEGSGGSESSLGWVLHEPVVWLDTLQPRSYLLTHSGRAVQTARDLLKRSASAKKQTNKQRQPHLTSKTT